LIKPTNQQTTGVNTMAIVQTVYFENFIDEFNRADRNHFSYEGFRALYDYLEQLSEDMGEPVELDVIDLCCTYSEYVNLEAVMEDYDCIKSIDDLEDHTIVIRVDNDSNGLIILNF
jgi:hypothetical protein